jgi:hypothetical protein
MCSTFGSQTQFISLCDPNWQFACFDSIIAHMQINGLGGPSPGGNSVFMVYTNNDQDHGGLYDVTLLGGPRGCVWFTKGFGGASTIYLEKIECTSASILPQINIGDGGTPSNNYGTTIVMMNGFSLGGPSGGSVFQTGPGIDIHGGVVNLQNVHCEEMPVCVEVANTISGLIGWIQNINGGSGSPAPPCTGVIQLDGTNLAGNTVLSQILAGSCTNVVTDAQSGGSNRSTAITTPMIFNP